MVALVVMYVITVVVVVFVVFAETKEEGTLYSLGRGVLWEDENIRRTLASTSWKIFVTLTQLVGSDFRHYLLQ